MPIFRSRRNQAPRLTPELDDTRLGLVLRRLETPAVGLAPMDIGASPTDAHLDLIEQLLKDADTDWERRTHRVKVLAGATDPGRARQWAQRRPHSSELLLQAWSDLEHGRRGRRIDDPQATIDACHRAAALQPADPSPWTALLGVLRLLRRPLREILPVWHEVTSRDAWHREAHLQMLGYLAPHECGSHAQQFEFVEAAVADMPPRSPAIGLELHALIGQYRSARAQGGLNELMAHRTWTPPHARSALDRALATWTQPGFLTHATALADLNLLAFCLARALRTAEAGQVFRAIGPTVTRWPWALDGDAVEQFTLWRAQALR